MKNKSIRAAIAFALALAFALTALGCNGNDDTPAPSTYALTYAANATDAVGDPAGGNYAAGASVTLAGADAYTRDGFTLTGWKDDDGTAYAPGASFTMPAKAVTMTAQWQANDPTPPATKYTVTYKSGDHGTGADIVLTEQSGDISLKAADTFTASEEGYVFIGWQIEGTDTVLQAGATRTLTEDLVLVAVWSGQLGQFDKNYTSTLLLNIVGNGGMLYVYDEATEKETATPLTYTLVDTTLTITIEGQTFTGTYDTTNGIVITLTVGGKTYEYVSQVPAEPAFTFHAEGGSGTAPTVTLGNYDEKLGYRFTLPQNTFTPPSNKQFKIWRIGTNENNTFAPGKTSYAKAGETVHIYAVWEDAPALSVKETVTFAGRCTTPTKTILGTTTGGQTYVRFTVNFTTGAISYETEDGKKGTVNSTADNDSKWKPTTYGEDAFYFNVATMIDTGYYFLIKADQTKLYLCDSDDTPLEGGEYTATEDSPSSDWVVINTSSTSDLDGKILYFPERFDIEYSGKTYTFSALEFTYSTTLSVLRVYVHFGTDGNAPVKANSAISMSSSAQTDDPNLIAFTSAAYKIVIGKKSDGNYYVTEFSYRSIVQTITAPLQETDPA